MEKKTTVLFEDNYGNRFVRSDGTKRSVVNIVDPNGRNQKAYRMNNVPVYEHPYLSWQNLDCCNGWWISDEDEAYLNTAVQMDRKLISEITLEFPEIVEEPSRDLLHNLVAERLAVLCPNLNPERETWRIDRTDRVYPNLFICNVVIIRKCCLADFFDAGEVAAAYHRQSYEYITKDALMPYFQIELTELFPDYDSIVSPCKTDLRCILTGLALGYPIESTVSYIYGY